MYHFGQGYISIRCDLCGYELLGEQPYAKIPFKVEKKVFSRKKNSAGNYVHYCRDKDPCLYRMAVKS